MDSTVFLAKLWGPTIIAVGVGVFVSRHYYMRIYRELEKDAFSVLLFGMIGMTAGVAHVLYHNDWSSFTAGMVSFLGWATLVKGTLFVVAPAFVGKSGNYWANKKLVPLAGTLSVIGGVYLIFVGYF